MKKILCLIDGLSSGGAQRQLTGLADLLNKNYDVFFVWYHSSDFYMPFLKQRVISYRQLSVGGTMGKFWGVLKTVYEYQPDVIIAYLDGPAIISCLIKLMRPKTKVIVSERNTTQKIALRVKLKFYLYKFADYVVPNSYSQKEFIEMNFPALKKKVHVITNFVDIVNFKPENADSREKILYILVVGRIATQKNVINFVKAIHEAKQRGGQFYVKWYGSAADYQQEYYKEVIALCEQYDNKDYFEFCQPKSEIIEEYRKCDVLCLPSVYEGYPNVICEAMSCGKPILCSDVNDNPLLVKNEYNGYLFNPKNIEDIAGRINQFCRMPRAERNVMGHNSRVFAEETFSKERFLGQYIALIEN